MLRNFYLYVSQNLKLLQVFLFGLFLFFLFRLVLFLRFGDHALVQTHTNDLKEAFLVGFRFDAMVLCYALIPVMALNLALLFWGKARFFAFVNKFSATFLACIISFMALILIIDQEYYTYFQAHINVLAFGLVEDDTAAVFTSVWSDHPIVIMTLIFIALAWLLTQVFKRIYRQQYNFSFQVKWPFIVLLPLVLIGLFVLGIRGSVGTFPLQQDDTTISDNEFINFLTPNGIFALKEAIKEKSGLFKKEEPAKLLKSLTYPSVQQALSDYYGRPETDFPATDIEQYLTQTTDTNTFLTKNPPNVVFFLMESMSNFYLDLHSPTLNLMGEFEKHAQQDFLFRNFWSGENGTIPSLENLMLAAPFHPLSQSAYRFKAFNSAVTKPFRQAGYETAFVTGGKLGWRNLDNFTPHQGFETAEGKEAILNQIKGAEQGEWGAYDEYLFQFVEQKLAHTKTGKPKFIFALSTTNHTPFQLPAHYKPYPVTLPDSVKNNLQTTPEIALKNFTNYQYAADCLGKFLTRLKASPLGKNTIVVATGDHNTFMLFQYKNPQMKLKYSVPFYLYVPEMYRKNSKTLTYQNTRFGSHKDIFPTIFNLALSGQKFVGLGNNLLAPETENLHYYAINEGNRAMDNSGTVELYFSKKMAFQKWTDGKKQRLVYAPKPTPAQLQLKKEAKAYTALMQYYFNSKF